MMESMDMRAVAVVIAVKRLDAAKTRLTPTIAADDRRALVLAMLTDTIAAARAAGLHQLVIVSPDSSVAAVALDAGASTVVDDGEVLNDAFALGIEHALTLWPGHRILVLQADLPAARPASLRAAVDHSAQHDRSYIPDHSGTGTTALFLNAHQPGGADVLRFGPNSASEHRGRGAVDLTAGVDRWPDLRMDVDTVDDLLAAQDIGVGQATSLVVSRLQLREQTQTPGATAPADGP
ncbi:2-phospho-L-lactate guanylyltransferase [Williamsia sp. 1138]|nr:2-phospho-L-lactate guanylyltransferase [Williamsia sp. 1138]